MKKFLVKLFIVALISITVAAAIELTLFAKDDAFWDCFEEVEENEEYYDYYDRY